MTSGYKAEYAKDSVGYIDWHSGVVAGKIKDNKRKVYLLISKETDGGNRINVPVFINETTREAEICTISNKIATVFVRNNLEDYLMREIRNGNLVRIKKKPLMSVNGTAPIAGDYNNNDLSVSKLSQNESDVNSKYSDRDYASYTEDRIDRIIAEYSASSPNYAQAYVATISPRDFLKLTINDEVLSKWNDAEMRTHPCGKLHTDYSRTEFFYCLRFPLAQFPYHFHNIRIIIHYQTQINQFPILHIYSPQFIS